MRRDGVLIEVWYLPAGAPDVLADNELVAYPSGGLAIDTTHWRCDPTHTGEGIAGVDARVLHLERVIKTCYGMALVFVRDALAHPYDLTNPGFLLGLLARGLVMDDLGDESAVVDPGRDFTQFTLLTSEQVATTFLVERAVRLRIVVREGDTPAMWHCSWLTPDGSASLGTFDVGVDAEEQIASGARAATSTRATTATTPTTAAPDPSSETTPAEPTPLDEVELNRKLKALRARWKRDPQARG